MTWINLLRDLGVFSIIAYAIQRIIDNSSSRKLETYKQELDFTIRSYQLTLDTDLERYKSEASLHFNKQTTLHERRLTIIVELDLSMRAMSSIVQFVVEDAKKEDEERVNTAQKAFHDFEMYLLLNKLYFNDSTVSLLENVRTEYRSANWDYFEPRRMESISGGELTKEERRDSWKKMINASKRISEDIPNIISPLKIEFQKLLGVI